MNKKTSIKNWSKDDRPREKLMLKGVSALSDSELIAILIGSGNSKQSAVELSRDILSSCKNNLNNLGKLSVADLMKFSGIGEAKAITIVAALELGKRRKVETALDKKQITSSQDVFDIFHPMISDLPHEEFWIAQLTNSNSIIDVYKTSQGGTTGTVIDIKLIMKDTLSKLAQALILIHNHPSGNIRPSTQDINVTKKIKEAANYFEIKLLDHVIIGEKTYYSFADNGEL